MTEPQRNWLEAERRFHLDACEDYDFDEEEMEIERLIEAQENEEPEPDPEELNELEQIDAEEDWAREQEWEEG